MKYIIEEQVKYVILCIMLPSRVISLNFSQMQGYYN